MALTPEQIKKYGLSASDATSSDHDEGIVKVGDSFYSIDNFERQQRKGTDTDQGDVFSSSLEKDSGLDYTNFNTATDVEGALNEIAGKTPAPEPEPEPEIPITYSEELGGAMERHKQFTEDKLSGKWSEAIFGPKRSTIAEGGVDDAATQQMKAAQVFADGFVEGIKRDVKTEIDAI